MNDYPVLALAYLGDAVYELEVRKFLLKQKIVKVKALQEKAILFVSAKAQAEIVRQLLAQSFFTAEEEDIYMRARNHKSHKSPKNTDIITYKCSTGLEAVIGYLYQKEDKERIEELMNQIFEFPFLKEK